MKITMNVINELINYEFLIINEITSTFYLIAINSLWMTILKELTIIIVVIKKLINAFVTLL